MVRDSRFMGSSVEIIGGVPQRVYHIPLDKAANEAVADLDLARILDRVIIGPTSYPFAMERAFQATLGEVGCFAVPVVLSKIPLRT
jgi:hypothetical protein